MGGWWRWLMKVVDECWSSAVWWGWEASAKNWMGNWMVLGKTSCGLRLGPVSFDTIFGAIPTCLSLSADSMLLALWQVIQKQTELFSARCGLTPEGVGWRWWKHASAVLNLARQLAHQIIIKAEGEAQQTLVRNQAAPVTFQLGQFWWVSGDQNSSASSAVHCPFIYIYTIYINLLQADVAQFKYRQQACHSVPSSVSLRVARWALGGTVQVLAEGYSKALNFFSSSGQEKDACDVNFWCLRMEHPPSYVYIYIYYIYHPANVLCKSLEHLLQRDRFLLCTLPALETGVQIL